MWKTFGTALLLSLNAAFCFGQSSYKGITPGQSTRVDSERVLGRPVKAVSATVVEYRPQPLTSKVYVQYRKNSPIVERIEVLCRLENSTCNDLIKSLGLTLPAALNGGMVGENFRELYGPPLFIVTKTNMTGVTESDVPPWSLAFYSRELYEAEFERIDKSNADIIAKIEEEQRKAPALSGVYGEITGIVKLRAADGSLQPVAGAAVDFYRTDDLPGSLRTKTDKYGVFRYLGLSQTGKWTVVVSGPGLKWNGVRNIQTPKAGIEIVLEPGDGSRPTREQVMAAIR